MDIAASVGALVGAAEGVEAGASVGASGVPGAEPNGGLNQDGCEENVNVPMLGIFSVGNRERHRGKSNVRRNRCSGRLSPLFNWMARTRRYCM